MHASFSLHLSCLPPSLSVLFPKIKQAQDEERRQLVQLRDILKSALQVEQKEVRALTLEDGCLLLCLPGAHSPCWAVRAAAERSVSSPSVGSAPLAGVYLPGARPRWQRAELLLGRCETGSS